MTQQGVHLKHHAGQEALQRLTLLTRPPCRRVSLQQEYIRRGAHGLSRLHSLGLHAVE